MHVDSSVVLVTLSATAALQAPVITVDEVEEEETFTLSDVSVTDSEMWDTASAKPKTSDQEMVPPTASQSSEKLLAMPIVTVEDEAEGEVIKKGGMAAAIARSFVVSIPPPATTLYTFVCMYWRTGLGIHASIAGRTGLAVTCLTVV